MSYIADFKVGDKIHKKMGENVDETIIYEIAEIWEEEDGNWHDGYQKLLYIHLVDDIYPYLLAYKILGAEFCLYGVLYM